MRLRRFVRGVAAHGGMFKDIGRVAMLHWKLDPDEYWQIRICPGLHVTTLFCLPEPAVVTDMNN